MKQFIEVTVRIGAVIQDVCANVDFEVVSLPGGSLIAVLLALYSCFARVARISSTEVVTLIRIQSLGS